MTGIQMDGVHYRVRVVYDTLQESARLPDGPNAGDMLSGRYERDLVGTYYDHQMDVEPDPRYPGDYDAFFAAITAPVATHTVVMPHGQRTITYQAMVYSAQHTSRGKMAGKRRWHGLSVQFQANAPQRAPA